MAADGARDARFQDAVHDLEDGLAMAYRDYPPTGEVAAEKLPVICLHGLTRNLLDFEDLAPEIAALGRRVIVPSLRGRGRSSWDPKPERYQPVIYAADVIGLVDALAIPRAVFIGTSLGGIVTMIVAAADPRRVACAVLNDVGGELAAEGVERIQGYVGRAAPAKDWPEAAARTRDVNGVAFPNADDPAFWLAFARRTWVETDAGLVADYDPAIGEAMRAQEPARGLWPLFDALSGTPTLLVRGALSDLLTRDTVAAMRARKPDLTVVEVPGVGHAPTLAEPEALAALTALLGAVE